MSEEFTLRKRYKEILDECNKCHIVFHNEDMDGWSSGAFVYGMMTDWGKINLDRVNLIPANYTDDHRKIIYQFNKNDFVIMVDFSLPSEAFSFYKYNNINLLKSMYIFDHHRSAYNNYQDVCHELLMVNKLEELNKIVNYYFDNYSCGFKLVANNLPEEGTLYEKYITRLIDTFDRHITKDEGLYNDARNFNFGFLANMEMPTNENMKDPGNLLKWYNFFHISELRISSKFIKDGEMISKFIDKKEIERSNNIINGKIVTKDHIYNCLILDNTKGTVGFKKVYDPLIHDIMVTFRISGNKWAYTLYSNKENIDCSLIAKEVGNGGGHKGAAGFSISLDRHPLNVFNIF